MTEQICFKPHTWETWQVAYRSHIRGCYDFKAINGGDQFGPKNRIEVETIFLGGACWDYEVYIPQKIDQDSFRSWVHGDYMEIESGTGNILLRLPGLLCDTRILIMDGCHRCYQLEPKFLIIDCLLVNESNYKFFLDMMHPMWGYHPA